jgi:hypothetical protein
MVSCQNILLEEPKTVFDPNGFYDTKEGVTATVYGIYDALANLYSQSGSGSLLVGTDLGCTKFASLFYLTFDQYSYGASDDVIFSSWVAHYSVISRANVLLDALKGSSADETVVNRAVAEAKFARAFSYFRMVQLWGPVPLVTEPSLNESPRAPLKNIYAQIIKDLEEAMASNALPLEREGGKEGRITVYAARTLLAKVYLTIASYKKYGGKVEILLTESGRSDYGYAAIPTQSSELYQKALDQIAEIEKAGFILEPNYCDVFSLANKNQSKENIFEIQFGEDDGISGNWSKDMGIHSWLDIGWQNQGWCGWTAIVHSPSFQNSYAKKDKRYEWNTPPYYIAMKSGGVYDAIVEYNPDDFNWGNNQWYIKSGIGKYRWTENWNEDHSFPGGNFVPTNAIVYRYADVLLMKAEVLVEKNNGSAPIEAVEAVNRIRNRARSSVDPVYGAGVTDPTQTPDFPNFTTSTLNLESIIKERAFELCYEHHRKFDLLRTGKLQEALLGRSPIAIIPRFKGGIDIPDFKLLWPIPTDEINKVKDKEGLYQNPSW